MPAIIETCYRALAQRWQPSLQPGTIPWGRTSGTITVTKCNTIAWEGLVGRVTVTKYKTGFKLVKE
jgi:hypothetical protein